MSVLRLHILGVPHTVTHTSYVACAFTQKVLKLCEMMSKLGHHVIHYGCEGSVVDCTEHVDATTRDDLEKAYGEHNWGRDFFKYDLGDSCYQEFYRNAIREVGLRKQPGDFLLCAWGVGHKAVADAHGDMIVVESGIGYSGGHFAPFKVFESYAMLHAFGGLAAVQTPGVAKHYDVVIPNAFDPAQFVYSEEKGDYLLCLGRITPGKGVHIAAEAVSRTKGQRLVVAGQGDFYRELGLAEVPPWVKLVGPVGVEQRAALLAKAKGVFVLSTYVEPFGGVQVEALFSGTPTITTDWGAFSENNLHGITGYRCRTMEHITWAIENIHTIKPQVCRAWAMANFTLERVAQQYDEYFWSVAQIYGGKGWYESNPLRTELDWLKRFYPVGDLPTWH